ncbi:MAG: hypothetical protein ACR2NF_06610 [Pirellulales bacterium]
MKTRKSEGSASRRDYDFWRSQHRPKSGNESPQTAADTFLDAIANRFGEELGSHSHDLFWDAFPNALKKGIGFGLGKVAPVLFAAGQAGKILTKGAGAEPEVTRLAYQSLVAIVDGRREAGKFPSLNEFFATIGLARGYWQVYSSWDPSSTLQWTTDADGNESELCVRGGSEKGLVILNPDLLQIHTAIRDFVRKSVINQVLTQFDIDADTNIEELSREQTHALAVILASCQAI